MDACRNDPNPPAAGGLTPMPLRRRKGGGGFVQLLAGQRAYEHDSLAHGVFFHFVLEGLKGGARDEMAK